MIRILYPGIYCTIQDLGRIGYSQKGIPFSGAMDQYSSKLANVLLKNRKSDAVIEITYGQGKFEFTEDVFICLLGGDFSPKINTMSVKMNEVFQVKKGDFLSFGKRKFGARVYLAIQGGFKSEVILKSRSFYPSITKLRLEKGDEISFKTNQKSIPQGFSKVAVFYEHFDSTELTCYPGPEFDQLDENQKELVFQSFTISEDNNRVGYRLNEVIENRLKPILTSAVLPGTVQLTPSGKLIVLMRDCQVTGGYPRILQLSDYAISRLSQKIAGQEVLFSLKIPLFLAK